MNHHIRVNLQTKVILTALIITLAPLISLALLNNRSVKQNLTDVANQSLSIAAEQTANRIDQFLLENLQEIQAAGQLRPFAQYLKLPPEKRSGSREETNVATILRTLSRRNLLLPTPYAILDASGINVLDTEPWRVGRDESRKIYFQKPFQTGDLFISPVLFSPDATRQAFFYVSGPVFNVAGDVVGVLRIQLSIAFLQDFIANTAGLAGPDSFGLLLDQNHLVLTHSTNPEMVFKICRPLSDHMFNQLQTAGQLPYTSRDKLTIDLPAFEKALQPSATTTVFTAPLTPGDDRRDQVAVAGLNQINWQVVLAQPRDAFLKPMGKQINSTLWLVSLISIVVIAAAIVVARQLTQPIVNMTAITRQIAAGDLTAQVPMTSRDELGQLAQSFNDMAAQLRESIGSLEQRLADLDRAKAALQESEERYRTLFDDSPISLWEEDFSEVREYYDRLCAEGISDFRHYFNNHPEAVAHCARLVKIEAVNKATVDLFKAEDKAALQASLPTLFSPQSLPIFCEELITLCEGGQRFEGEVTQQTLSGEEIAVVLRLSLAPGYENSWAKVLVSLNDITERKRVEAESRENEEKFRTLVESSSDLIWEVDQEGTYAYISPKIKNVLGYDPDEVIGKTPFHLMAKDAIATARSQFEAAVARALPITALENENQHKDGTSVILETSGVPIFDASGNLKGYRGVDRDITKRKLAENELKEYRDHLEALVKTRTAELEAKNKELEVFTYSVSHDLKAPLRGIDGYSRLLVEEYANKLDDEGLLFLQNVRQSTTQMNQLIEDLLSYSRLERRDIQPGSTDLQSMIDMLISQRRHEIETRKIRVSVKLPLKTVISDNETLRQILGNYLDNAIKFSKKDAPASVEIASRDDNDAWIIWVKDNGIGFDLKYHERIFNIFQRLQRAEDFPGTGIGLAIVHKAAERIGGRVWAESTVGQGATFFISIPKNKFVLKERN